MGPILPSSVTLTELTQSADGTLTPIKQYPIDFSSVGGDRGRLQRDRDAVGHLPELGREL